MCPPAALTAPSAGGDPAALSIREHFSASLAQVKRVSLELTKLQQRTLGFHCKGRLETEDEITIKREVLSQWLFQHRNFIIFIYLFSLKSQI